MIILYPLPGAVSWGHTLTCHPARAMHVCKRYPDAVICLPYHILPQQVRERLLWKLGAWWLQRVRILLSCHSWVWCLHGSTRKGSRKSVTSILLPKDTSCSYWLALDLRIQMLTLPDPTYLLKADKITAWSSIATGSILATKMSV